MQDYMQPDAIIQLKQTYFYPNTMHFYKNPPHMVKGDMQYLYDETGKRYTDFFAGVTVLNCGHSNQAIIRAVTEQLNKLQHTSIIYLTQPMVALAQKLSEVLPGDIQQTFFCNSGTEANEGALTLARMHTKRKAFLAFEGGLHGRSHLTMSVTGIPMWRIDPYLDESVYFATCYAKTGMSQKDAMEASLGHVDEILKAHGHEIAACIVEPIQGNGGIYAPHPEFFKALKSRLEAYGVLLIADEIQTGFGRTGSFFAVEQYGIVPDIITYAKALGNGIPIGAFSARPHVAASFNKPSASTLGGNPVSCTAGIAVIDYMKEHDLCARTLKLGALLKEGLMRIAEKHACALEVRGMGLMLGMEVSSPAQVDFILEAMKERGFIVGKNGINRNVLAFQPPLIIEENDIAQMLAHLEDVFLLLPATE